MIVNITVLAVACLITFVAFRLKRNAEMKTDAVKRNIEVQKIVVSIYDYFIQEMF